MALGTITQNAANSKTGTSGVGDLKVVNVDVVGDSSYPTGGSTITPQQLGLGSTVVFSITSIKVTGGVGTPSEAYYDIPTQKLLVYTTAGQVANTTVLSASTFQITAFGY